MLAIQPVSLNTNPKKVSFQMNERKTFEDERDFFEQQKREIEDLIDDNRLPGGMKKFLKVANVVTDALIAGFTVACATIATATCGKNTYSKIANNKTVKNVINAFKPLGECVVKGFKSLKQYAGKLVRKLFGEEKGQAIIDSAKRYIKKVASFFKRNNPFKDEAAYDKAAAKTATGLGVGAGAASAYAKSVDNAEKGDEE